ncbi:hypothetical protein BKA62DRAFT_772516 [Auriculariales sp. MPI-PUGE-AT-0066]|nr:hypothetical protein BKA62DRAFT_772516 [Auriculariales sp. MPI-PUGE-AT-0066]
MAKPMPVPTSNKAPHFDGTPRCVCQFLNQYSIVADEAKLGQFEKVCNVTAYMEDHVAEMVEQYKEWVDLDKANTPQNAWDDFKKHLLEDYPDTGTPKVYRCMEYKATFHEFNRKWNTHTGKIAHDGDVSTKELLTAYGRILHRVLGDQLAVELRLYESKKTQPKPIELDDLKAVTKSLYEARAKQTDIASIFAFILEPVCPIRQQPVPRVKFEDDATIALTNWVRVLEQQIAATQNQNRGANRTPPPQTRASNNIPSGQYQSGDRCDGCFYCGGPHNMHEDTCSKFREALHSGKVKCNSYGHVVLADKGQHIPRKYPNEPFKHGVERHYREFPRQTGNSNYTSFSLTIDDAPVRASDHGAAATNWLGTMYDKAVVLSQERATKSVAQGAQGMRQGLRSQGHANDQDHEGGLNSGNMRERDAPPHFDGRKEADGVSRGDPRIADRSQAPTRSPTPATAPAPVPACAPLETATVPPLVYGTWRAVAPGPQLQYRLRLAVSNPDNACVVANKVLRMTVELELGQLLGLSPEVQCLIRGDIMPHRTDIGTNLAQADDGVDVYSYEILKPNEIHERRTADYKVNLRYVDTTIGHVVAEGLLDSGSQVCLMSKCFWAALGSPAVLTEQLTLVSANSTKAQTVGLCEHLQVIEAPFDLLLGRPFYVVLHAIDENKLDGTTYLMLHDANLAMKIRLSMKERVSESKCAMRLVPSAIGNPHNNYIESVF